MDTLNHNVRRTHDFENLQVEGTIPSDLRGTLYRTGPGLVERFGQTVHPFLADGLLTAVKLAEKPSGASELVKSAKFVEEEQSESSLYGPNAALPRRIVNGLTQNVKDTGNTQVFAWQDRLFALMEQGHPVEFDGTNLETIGSTDLGIVSGSFSAHPHRVEARRTTYNFGVAGRTIRVYALPDTGPIRELCEFKAPWASLIHDFMVTNKHVLFFIDPAKLVIWRAALGLRDFSRYFRWDTKESSNIFVVPIDQPDQITRIEVDPFRVWHFANAYEEGDQIVVDAFRHENIDVLTNPTELDETIKPPELCRFRIDVASKRFSSSTLGSVSGEFPSVNPLVAGTKHRHIWMQTYTNSHGNEGFARFDIETGKFQHYEAPDGHMTSEPMFVPNGDQETTGWVLQLTKDPNRDQSYLSIHDAQNVEASPCAKIWFEQAIPATFHGTFVPEPSKTTENTPRTTE